MLMFRTRVNTIEQNLQLAKSDYAAALRTLETISEQIHLQRKLESLEVTAKSNAQSKNENRPGPSSDSLNVPDRPNSEQVSLFFISLNLKRVSSEHINQIFKQ